MNLFTMNSVSRRMNLETEFSKMSLCLLSMWCWQTYSFGVDKKKQVCSNMWKSVLNDNNSLTTEFLTCKCTKMYKKYIPLFWDHCQWCTLFCCWYIWFVLLIDFFHLFCPKMSKKTSHPWALGKKGIIINIMVVNRIYNW